LGSSATTSRSFLVKAGTLIVLMLALLSVRSDPKKKGHRTSRGRWPFFRLEGFTVYAGSSPPAAERPPAQIGVRFVACAPRPVPHTASFATWRWLIRNR